MLATLLNRPYVFLFLISFLIIGILKQGVRQTLFFLCWGYFVAWISEAISIRTGFPYGWYFYIYENMKGELMNWGVPVWDSLSYTFLCYAGLSVALKGLSNSPCPPRLNGQKIQTALWAALFVMVLDIIVDPLAHIGDKWFLGKIYYYPYPGYYFDVPVSNFIGWFFVAFVIVYVYLVFASKIPSPSVEKDQEEGFIKAWGGVSLYFGIFTFNLLITLWLKEWLMAAFDIFWILIPLGFLWKKTRK